jgi:DNA-directed RNA polymerase subunit RPC12/RpoP
VAQGDGSTGYAAEKAEVACDCSIKRLAVRGGPCFTEGIGEWSIWCERHGTWVWFTLFDLELPMKCSSCGSSTNLPMRKDDRAEVVCNSCFERWRFFDEKDYARWRIVGGEDNSPPQPAGA